MTSATPSLSAAQSSPRFAPVVQPARRGLLTAAPEFIFLFFATIGGLALIALIPPMGGGNEFFNFQRVAGIAAFHPLVEPAQIPAGVLRFLQTAHEQFNPTRLAPFHYSSRQFDALASIALDADKPATLEPNPISVLNPVSYVPQVAAYWLGEALGWGPLALFYLGRLAGLAAAILLTFFAIRRMPYHRIGLCALALLPTIAFTRSTLDADQVTNGLCFLFVASLLRVATKPERIPLRTILFLAALGFFTAQAKTAYLVLLPLAFAVPVERYGSPRRWLFASLLIALPGFVASFAWMVALQRGYFAGIHYYVLSSAIYPDGQVRAILADPIAYAGVLARTLFASSLLPMTLLGLLGIFGPPVLLPALAYPLLLGVAATVLLSEGRSSSPKPSLLLRAIAVGVFFAGFGLILTLVYIQWSALGAPVISGFNGRYLYPLLPALMIFLPSKTIRLFGLGAEAWLVALGVTASCCTLGVTWTTYWA
jgi:hypothetical protein